MSSPYTPTPTYASQITMPDDIVDSRSASVLRTSLEALANQTKHVIDRRLPYTITADYTAPAQPEQLVSQGTTVEVLRASANFFTNYTNTSLAAFVVACLEMRTLEPTDLTFDILLGTTFNGVDVTSLTQRWVLNASGIRSSVQVARNVSFGAGTASSADVWVKIAHTVMGPGTLPIRVGNITIAGHILRNAGV